MNSASEIIASIIEGHLKKGDMSISLETDIVFVTNFFTKEKENKTSYPELFNDYLSLLVQPFVRKEIRAKATMEIAYAEIISKDDGLLYYSLIQQLKNDMGSIKAKEETLIAANL